MESKDPNEPKKDLKVPAANKKLKNIDTLKKMLDGTHWTQTRNSVSFADVEKRAADNRKRAVGEKWIDDLGFEWEQKEGYRVRIGKLDSLREELHGKTFPKCPKEKCEVSNHNLSPAQQKMKALHGMCINCVADLETKLKIRGEYEQYELNKMKENALAWLRDAELEKDEMKKILTTAPQFVNEDGTVEKWEIPYDPIELGQKMDDEFNKFKEEFLKNLENAK